MKTEYLFSLPFPPSVNSYYGIKCNNHIPIKYVKTKGKDYQKLVKELIVSSSLELRANIDLAVTLEVTPPDRRIHDIDNILKSLFDSLTYANFWQDDSFVRKLNISYRPPDKPGSVLIYVEALNE